MCAEGMTNGCAGCGCADDEPEAMRRMAAVLGVDRLLAGEARAEAAALCESCTQPEACREWLPLAEIRGAGQAPGFCRNAERFDRLASEAPTTF